MNKNSPTKRNHKTFILFISLLSLYTTSCDWDDTVYNDFVTEDGETLTITKCPRLDANGQSIDGHLGYIEYVKNEDGNPVSFICHADACRSEDNCCNLEDSVLRRQFSNGFVHNLCPANYRCVEDYDTKEYYCTSQKERVCGSGETVCGDKCYNLSNDENHCGDCAYVCSPEGLDAEYAEGEKRTATALCLNGQCHANTCQKGYHPEEDKDNNNILRCVPDNAENCNGINCNLLAGCQKTGEIDETSETDGHCICDSNSNLCTAERCEPGYHTYNENGVPCLADTDTACGSDKINCNNKSKWSDEEKDSVGSKYCYQGKCAVYACATDYHFDITNTRCERDDIDHCGSYNNDCNTSAGWKEGKCENGTCKATTCKTFYHPYNGTCELNTIEHCESHDNNCNNSPNKSVSDYNCITENNFGKCVISRCSENYHPIYNDLGRIDRCEEDKETACGSQYDSCLINGVKSAECIAPHVCKAKDCTPGYHQYNDNRTTVCEMDTSLNCGEHGRKCSDGYCDVSSGTAECTQRCPNTICGSDCVDTQTNSTHCGSCHTETNNSDCRTIYPDASVKCENGVCQLLSCNIGFHQVIISGKSRCDKDTKYACGPSMLDCTDSNNQKANANMDCQDSTCTYTCKEGYADCDKLAYNGCETYLNDYGLILNEDGHCICDQNSHLDRCGYINRDGVTLPLCLKQGNYYKNYYLRSSLDVGNSCSKYGWAATTLNKEMYCFDRCTHHHDPKTYDSVCTEDVINGRTYVHYDRTHYYDQLSDHWNAELLEWNEANCIKACNTSDGYYFTSNNNRESRGHTCDPKFECDMFDSAEYIDPASSMGSGAAGKQYIDYGCTY